MYRARHSPFPHSMPGCNCRKATNPYGRRSRSPDGQFHRVIIRPGPPVVYRPRGRPGKAAVSYPQPPDRMPASEYINVTRGRIMLKRLYLNINFLSRRRLTRYVRPWFAGAMKCNCVFFGQVAAVESGPGNLHSMLSDP